MLNIRGMPLQIATAQQMRTAIMLGRCVHRDESVVAYSYRGELFILTQAEIPGLKPEPERTAAHVIA